MTGRGRMYDSNRNIAIVPISDILAGFYLMGIKALLDSLQVVLEPVREAALTAVISPSGSSNMKSALSSS